MKYKSHLLLALALIFFFWVEYRGVDFGNHWDEKLLFKAVETSINTGTLLPSMYNYPSVSYYITLSRIAPDILYTVMDTLSSNYDLESPVRKEILTPTTDHLTEKDFVLQVRCIFAAITLLSVVWTYLLVLSWRKSWMEAAIAGILLGSSWEISYHARWIAPDGVLMQFSILTMLLIILSMKNEKRARFWLRCAAGAAGLTCGTKYFGGVMLVPVMLTYAHYQNKTLKSASKSYGEYFVLFFFFCISFLITTPGALLQPVYFVYEVRKQMGIYNSGWWGHTVNAGLEHFILNIRYLSLVVFSRYWPISLFFSMMVPLGIYVLSKDNFFKACIFISGPVIWLFYISAQKIMSVHNVLLLVPFMAVLSSIGISSCIHIVKKLFWKTFVISIIFLCLIINSVWLVKASDTIRERVTVDHAGNAYEYIRENGNRMFFLSKGVRDLLSKSALDNLPNVSNTLASAQEYIFQSREPFLLNLQANKRGRYKVISGAYDINFDYYPLWEEPKIISVPIRDALAMAIISPYP